MSVFILLVVWGKICFAEGSLKQIQNYLEEHIFKKPKYF